MSDDNEDHISRVQRHANVRFGRERTAQEMATDFALYAPNAREMLLADLKTPKAMTLLEAARRHAVESALRTTDAKLRKVGR